MLRSFEAAARYGHFKGAAEELRLSPSAISIPFVSSRRRWASSSLSGREEVCGQRSKGSPS